jgi:hypothetical protein
LTSIFSGFDTAFGLGGVLASRARR